MGNFTKPYFKNYITRLTKLRLILAILLTGCFLSIFCPPENFAFEAPPTIDVTKPTGGTVHYVDINAVNGGNGTAALPWKSLEEADGNVIPGDTIRIKTGIYYGISWDQSGSLGKEIVVEAFGDGDVIFSGRSNLNGNYVIFDGGPGKKLIFDGSDLSNQYTIYTFGSNITLWRIISRNCGKNLGTGSAANISIRGDGLRVYNCEIYGSVSVGIYGRSGNNSEIRNSMVYNNQGTGIQYNPHVENENVNNLIISGNAIYNNGLNGTRPGISLLASSSGHILKGVYVFNNMLWKNVQGGIKLDSSSGDVSDIFLFNNTVFNNQGLGIWNKLSETATVKNNIVFNNAGGSISTTSGGSYLGVANNLTTDPSFLSTNVSDSNYMRLSPTSTAAIDKGADIGSMVTNDYFGDIRANPDTIDIGADEYGAAIAGNPPGKPSGLRLQ